MTAPDTPSSSTANEARDAVHVALEDVENMFKDIYGSVSSRVKTLLGHLHDQADGMISEGEADLKSDEAEVKSDVQTITVTGQNALGGGVNPNAVHPTTPAPNIPVQQETQQQVPSTPPVQG